MSRVTGQDGANCNFPGVYAGMSAGASIILILVFFLTQIYPEMVSRIFTTARVNGIIVNWTTNTQYCCRQHVLKYQY